VVTNRSLIPAATKPAPAASMLARETGSNHCGSDGDGGVTRVVQHRVRSLQDFNGAQRNQRRIARPAPTR